jgi:hypothetical protein
MLSAQRTTCFRRTVNGGLRVRWWLNFETKIAVASAIFRQSGGLFKFVLQLMEDIHFEDGLARTVGVVLKG